VADICARLDGLPLPIELAAARVHDVWIDASRLWVNRRAMRPARQRTLRDAMNWSHDLLSR
jgi:non-specific serine/threonine protein kinase